MAVGTLLALPTGAYGVLRGEPAALVFLLVGLYALTDVAWWKVRVTDTELVAQGRFSRRRATLATVRDLGISTFGTVWVAPADGRAFSLRMVSPYGEGGVQDFYRELRTRVSAAGGAPGRDPDDLSLPPKDAHPVFSV